MANYFATTGADIVNETNTANGTTANDAIYLQNDITLTSGQGPEQKDPEREKARDEARKRLEEEAKKPPQDRKTPEFGSAEDFPLRQALNNLKGVPVVASKTQVVVENKEEKKEN